MPRKSTEQKAKKALKEGKRPTTAAGAFVREEMEHVKEGKHGARSRQQAVAIGLSKARRAGVPLKAPAEGTAGEKTRRSAQRDLERGKKPARRPSAKRSKASAGALRREPQSLAARRVSAPSRGTRSGSTQRRSPKSTKSRKTR